MTYSLTWLADVLRAAKLAVAELPGWQTRGRGPMGAVKGVMLHHTACSAYSASPDPSLGTVEHGRPDLPGPLAHLLLGKDGVYHVVAAGRCNHAGRGVWQHISSGNSCFIGIEAENDGVHEPWPAIQMDAYHKGVAALLKHLGAKPGMACGHKEYCLPKGRKTDPDFDMVAFRVEVAKLMGEENDS